MMNQTLILLFFSIAITSCSTQAIKDTQLEELYSLMQGSFNSAEQAMTDSGYFDISLHMYPIWEGKNHFYVEQSVSNMQDRPYRQRVYQLIRTSDSTITSFIYKIPNDSLWIGAKTPAMFNELKLPI